MELKQKLTPELTSQKKKQIYKFCDEFISGLDFMSCGDYYNDDRTLHLKLVLTPYDKTIVKYGHINDFVEVEIGIKKLDKSFQLFMLLWGFCKKYCENSGSSYSENTYTQCDIITAELFKQYASAEYDFKKALICFIEFLGNDINEHKIKRVRAFIDRYTKS